MWIEKLNFRGRSFSCAKVSDPWKSLQLVVETPPLLGESWDDGTRPAPLLPEVLCCHLTRPLTPQRCDIGDASRGSLSSYAYILMVLYFLQQREPPVIPVLQEVSVSLRLWLRPQRLSATKTVLWRCQIFDGPAVPQRMVDGWNAFFCDNPDNLVSWRE